MIHADLDRRSYKVKCSCGGSRAEITLETKRLLENLISTNNVDFDQIKDHILKLEKIEKRKKKDECKSKNL